MLWLDVLSTAPSTQKLTARKTEQTSSSKCKQKRFCPTGMNLNIVLKGEIGFGKYTSHVLKDELK